MPPRGITYTDDDIYAPIKNCRNMKNLQKDKKRAAELLELLLDDTTDSATKEKIRAWLWSKVSNEAKDAAMLGLFRQMASNTTPDEYDHKKYAELAALLNIEGQAPVPAVKKRSIPFFRTPVRVAAAAVLLLCISGVAYLWLNRTGEHPVAGVTESAGPEARSIQLPDGSSVELQANSTLTYDEDFTSGRRVHLDGEALLTVEKSTGESGELIPFSVVTDDLKVDVYGTVFRVIDPSDDNDQRSIVFLYDGSVSVSSKDGVVTLGHGEEYHFDHAVQKSSIGLILAKEMIEHGFLPLLRFDESNLGNIVTALTANYGVEFDMPDDIDLSRGKFSGDFQEESLNSTLSILTRSSTRLNFTLAGDRVLVKRK